MKIVPFNGMGVGCVIVFSQASMSPLVLVALMSAISFPLAAAAEQQGRGLLELMSEETVLTVGGRVNLTGYWDSPVGSFSAAGVPTDSSGEDNELTMHLRNSRLWFKTRTQTDAGQIQTYIETDFGGSAGTEVATNSHNLRLRHAIFQLGGLTVGQTWSTFQTYVSPDILTDAAYIQWTRQPMIRWSVDNGHGYDLALEQPETLLSDSSGGQVQPSDDRVPDLVARLRQVGSNGKAAAAVILREIRQDHAILSDGTTQLSNTDSKLGWGINLSAMFYVADVDDLSFGLIHGNGIGRYIALNSYNDGALDNQGSIQLQRATGGYLAYRHWWSEKLRSSIAYSLVQTDNDLDLVPASANKEAYSYHINLFWTPLTGAQYGIEYAFLEREQEDGQTADMQRLYFELRHDF